MSTKTASHKGGKSHAGASASSRTPAAPSGGASQQPQPQPPPPQPKAPPINAWSRPLQPRRPAAPTPPPPASAPPKGAVSQPPGLSMPLPSQQQQPPQQSSRSGSNNNNNSKTKALSSTTPNNNTSIASGTSTTNSNVAVNKSLPAQQNPPSPASLSRGPSPSSNGPSTTMTPLGTNRGSPLKETSSNGNSNNSTAGTTAALRGRFLQIMLSLVGQKVTITMRNGARYTGVFHTATPFPPAKVFPDYCNKYVLKAVAVEKEPMSNGTVAVQPGQTVVIDMEQVVDLHVKSLRVEGTGGPGSTPPTSGGVNFSTDSEISGGQSRGGRALVEAGAAWTSSSGVSGSLNTSLGGTVGAVNSRADGLLGSSGPRNPTGSSIAGSLQGSIGAWDQFKANEELFNVRGNFDESIYTTTLDKNALTPDEVQQAERLAREIETSTSTNLHIAEERGQKVETDFDEEDRYSGVLKSAAPPIAQPTPSLASRLANNNKKAPASKGKMNYAAVAAAASASKVEPAAAPPGFATSSKSKAAEAPSAAPPKIGDVAPPPAKEQTPSKETPPAEKGPVSAAAAAVAKPAESDSKVTSTPNRKIADEKTVASDTKAAPVTERTAEAAKKEETPSKTTTETPSSADPSSPSPSASKGQQPSVPTPVTPEPVAAAVDKNNKIKEKEAETADKANKPATASVDEVHTSDKGTPKETGIEESRTPTAPEEKAENKDAKEKTKTGSKLNANAPKFTFNINAKTFTPGGGFGGTPAAPTPVEQQHQPPPQQPQQVPHQPQYAAIDPNTGMPMAGQHMQPGPYMQPGPMGQPVQMMQQYPGMRYPTGQYPGMEHHMPPMVGHHQPGPPPQTASSQASAAPSPVPAMQEDDASGQQQQQQIPDNESTASSGPHAMQHPQPHGPMQPPQQPPMPMPYVPQGAYYGQMGMHPQPQRPGMAPGGYPPQPFVSHQMPPMMRPIYTVPGGGMPPNVMRPAGGMPYYPNHPGSMHYPPYGYPEEDMNGGRWRGGGGRGRTGRQGRGRNVRGGRGRQSFNSHHHHHPQHMQQQQQQFQNAGHHYPHQTSERQLVPQGMDGDGGMSDPQHPQSQQPPPQQQSQYPQQQQQQPPAPES